MESLKKLVMVVCMLMIAVFMVACNRNGNDDSETVRIAAKNFTENLILAEIYALALEDIGIQVERIGGMASGLVHNAITNNEIDLYPEYTGTGLLVVLGHELITDPDEVFRIVSEEYEELFDIIWLNQSSVNNSQGLMVSKRVSEEFGITTISDLQHHAENLRFVSQGEFDLREDGLPLLIEVYGPFDFLDRSVIDRSLIFEVLRNGEADAATTYTTNGSLLEDDFVLLEDDLRAWPPYHIAPIIRREVLEEHPEIADVLNRISAALDSGTMIRLNWEVDVNHREVEDVAREFFESMR